MKEKLTKQESIIVALMRGNHLSPKELEIAAEQVRIMSLNINGRYYAKSL